VEKWIEETMKTKNVWFARLEDIADHMDCLRKAGTWSPWVEKLPYYAGPVLR
jgi:peptidoglycan-N-acetylglucosamine deacetylase